MIHLNGEEYRRAFNSAPAFPHNAMLPSPDPDAAPGTMRSYRFRRDAPLVADDVPGLWASGPPVKPRILRAEYLDGAMWKPVHSLATLRALAKLPLDDRNGSPEVKAIAPTAP